jgi:N-acetylglutamate synthase-like GNAT family acetyltransferase
MNSSPDGLRVPTAEDTAAIAALFAKRRPLDAREVRSWFANPTFDPANDFRVFERAGAVVGYVDVHPEVDRLSVDWASNDPDVSHALLDWCEERARAQGIDRLVAHEWPNSEDLGAVLRERGFTPFRASLEMQVPLDDATAEPVWPDRIEGASGACGRRTRRSRSARGSVRRRQRLQAHAVRGVGCLVGPRHEASRALVRGRSRRR